MIFLETMFEEVTFFSLYDFCLSYDREGNFLTRPMCLTKSAYAALV